MKALLEGIANIMCCDGDGDCCGDDCVCDCDGAPEEEKDAA